MNVTESYFTVNQRTFVKNQVSHTLQVGITLFQLLSSNDYERDVKQEVQHEIMEETADTYVINKSAWCTNNDFNTRFQNSNLFELGDTAIDDSVLDITRRAKFVAFFFDLNSKLTSGSEGQA